MIHVSSGPPGSSRTVVGNGAVIGAGAILHGCTVEEDAYVGAGSQVMDGAVVGKGAAVGAGAVLTAGKVVPAGQLWAGVPAAYVRHLSAAEAAAQKDLAAENVLLAAEHAAEETKSFRQIEFEEYEYEQIHERNNSYYPRLTKEELSYQRAEIEGHRIPGRVFDSPGTSPSRLFCCMPITVASNGSRKFNISNYLKISFDVPSWSLFAACL